MPGGRSAAARCSAASTKLRYRRVDWVSHSWSLLDQDRRIQDLFRGGGVARAIEKEIDGGNPAVPGDEEISPGVGWRLAGGTRHPPDPRGVAQLFGLADRLILKVRMSSFDHARDAVDLVAATVGAAVGVVEHAIFVVELVNGRAPARGVFFAEDVAKIAKYQGRCAVGHGFFLVVSSSPAADCPTAGVAEDPQADAASYVPFCLRIRIDEHARSRPDAVVWTPRRSLPFPLHISVQ